MINAIKALIDKIKGKDTTLEKELRKLEKEYSALLKEDAKNEKSTGEGAKNSLSPTKIKRLEQILDNLGKKQIKVKGEDKTLTILTDKFTRNKAIYSQKGRDKSEVNARIKAIPEFESIIKSAKLYKKESVRNFDNEAKDGVVAIYRGKTTFNGFNVEIIVRDKGKRQYLYELQFKETKNKKSSRQSMTKYSVSPVSQSESATSKYNISQLESSVNIKSSISSKTDAEYMSAVENGDTETAQKIVDETAHNLGYTIKAYHGSRSNFTVFDKTKGGQSNSEARLGFWFTESKEGAQNFANETWYGDSDEAQVYGAYLKLNNPKVYKSADNSAQIENLREEKTEIDREMSLLDSMYFFEEGRYYHTERHDYDFSKRRRVGIAEWDAFKAIVRKFDADDVEYYLSKVAEADRQAVKNDAERYLELSEQSKKLGNQITELSYSDAYELFRTDIYSTIGKSAEDANTGGIGIHVENSAEMLQKYADKLKAEGYDGIIIEGTEYDAITFGGKNNQYLVFEPNQIKSAEPITYDNDGNVIPLSERFNADNNDIRYSLSREDRAQILKDLPILVLWKQKKTPIWCLQTADKGKSAVIFCKNR